MSMQKLAITALATLLLCGLIAPALAQTTHTHYPPIQFKDRAEEVRFQNLTKQLRCLVCQDESLFASQADLAKQMRHLVYRQMQKGWTDQQIKQYLVDRYSDYVLYKPPLRPSTWLLWFGPGVILLFGAAVVVITVRRRKHGVPDEPVDTDPEDW